MRLTGVHLPEELIRRMDMLVEAGMFPDRAEVIRFAVVNMLREMSFDSDKIGNIIKEIVSLRAQVQLLSRQVEELMKFKKNMRR